MRLYRCDRCSAEVAAPPGAGVPAVAGITPLDILGKHFDLCSRCVKDLARWLEPLPQAAKQDAR